MAKLTAILVTILGVWMLLADGALAILPPALTKYEGWIMAIVVLVIGIGKLVRNFKKK